MVPLKKTLIVSVCGQEVAVNVDFDTVRIIEEVYRMSGHAVLRRFFLSPENVQLHKVAQVISEWVALHQPGIGRRAVLEEVVRSTPTKMALYVGAVYSALSFLLNYYNEKDPADNERQFDEAAQRISAGLPEDEGEQPTKKAVPAASKKLSSESATKLQ